MVIGVVGWGSVWGWEGGGWRGGRTSVGDSVDVSLLGGSLSTGDAVCGGVVNGLSSTVDLWDSLSSMSFIDPSELLCSFPLCLPSVPGILGELLCDFNDRPRRLPSSSWNVSLPRSSHGGNSGVDSLLCSGGVGDHIVICMGSSQCMVEGCSTVPQQ